MGGSSTTTQKADPWAPAQPHIMMGLNDAASLYQQGGFYVDPYNIRTPEPQINWGNSPNLPGSAVAAPEPAVPNGDLSRVPGQTPKTGDLSTLTNTPTPTMPRDPNNNADRPLRSLAGPNDALKDARKGIVKTAERQSDLVRGAQNVLESQSQGVDNAAIFDRVTGDMSRMEAGRETQRGIRKAQSVGTTGAYEDGIQRALRGGNRAAAFDRSVNNAISGDNRTGIFERVVGEQSRAQGPDAVNRAVQTGLDQGNTAAFDRAVNFATQDGIDDNLRRRLRDNVTASIAPQLNSAFAGSGMTGSGLHAQNLAKGLSAGMSEVEADLINRAQDRALEAGNLSQGALEANRTRALNAGNLAMTADNAIAGRQLDAASMSQNQRDTNIGRQLDAGQMAQNQLDTNLDRRIATGMQDQQVAMDLARLGLDAGQAQASNDLAFADAQMRGANARQNQRNFDTQNQGQAALSVAGLQDAAFTPFQQLGEVGLGRRADEQARLDDAINRNIQAQQGPLSAIQNYLTMTSNLGGQYATQSATSSQNPGLLGMLGLGLQGVGLLSDRRAKENIRRIGRTDDGLPVYVYTYKGDDVVHMGVMADEVERVKPHAVQTGSNGLKRVNYGAL